MLNEGGSNPAIQNSIFSGNTASGSNPQIRNFNFNPGSDIPTLSNSLVEGSGGSGAGWDTDLGTDGGGNLDTDPLFADPDGVDDSLGTLDDDVRLSMGSLAINSGNNGADLDAGGPGTTTISDIMFDLDGLFRIAEGTVDMGPYEFGSVAPSPTPTITPLATQTPMPSDTPTITNTPTISNTAVATNTPSDTPAETPTETATEIPTETATEIPTDTATVIPTATATETVVSSETPTVSSTPTTNYDIAPDPVDGQIDALDLLGQLERDKDGSSPRDLLFDFSRFWQSTTP